MTPRGLRRHLVTVQTPTGSPVPDGDGGYTQNFATIATVRASITAASLGSLERLAAGTVIAQATHIIGLPYIAALTTKAKIVTVVAPKTYNVLGIIDPGEVHREHIVTASEVVA